VFSSGTGVRVGGGGGSGLDIQMGHRFIFLIGDEEERMGFDKGLEGVNHGLLQPSPCFLAGDDRQADIAGVCFNCRDGVGAVVDWKR